MIDNYDFMTDEEVLFHTFQKGDSTPLENTLAKRLEKYMDLHEGVSEGVFVQAVLATQYPECSGAALERIVALVSPPLLQGGIE